MFDLETELSLYFSVSFRLGLLVGQSVMMIVERQDVISPHCALVFCSLKFMCGQPWEIQLLQQTVIKKQNKKNQTCSTGENTFARQKTEICHFEGVTCTFNQCTYWLLLQRCLWRCRHVWLQEAYAKYLRRRIIYTEGLWRRMADDSHMQSKSFCKKYFTVFIR